MSPQKKKPRIATVSKAARPATDVAYSPYGVLPMAAGVEKRGYLHKKKRPRIATVSKAARPATDVAYNPDGVLPMAAGVPATDVAYNPDGVLPMAAGVEKRGYLHKKKGRVCDLFLLWRWADSNRRPSEPLQSFLHA